MWQIEWKCTPTIGKCIYKGRCVRYGGCNLMACKYWKIKRFIGGKMELRDFYMSNNSELQEYLDTCEEIVNKNGICHGVECVNCPFEIDCSLYAGEEHSTREENYTLVENCKKFIEKFKDCSELELSENSDDLKEYCPHCGGVLY